VAQYGLRLVKASHSREISCLPVKELSLGRLTNDLREPEGTNETDRRKSVTRFGQTSL
jgi:hypothetical protein